MAILSGATCFGPNAVTVPGIIVAVTGPPTPGTSFASGLLEGIAPADPPTSLARTTSRKLNGGECKEFGERFWRNHWHIREAEYPLGNVLSDQDIEFFLHNAYRRPQNVIGITEDGVSGITLENNGVPTFSVNGQTTVSYTVGVSKDGNPSINYTALFDLGPSGGSLSVNVTGQRLIVFVFDPQQGITESWSYLTDIIQSASGLEQRVSVRDVPVQKLALEVLEPEATSAQIENMIHGWPPNQCAIPIHTDLTFLTAQAGIGDLTIFVEQTDDSHFAVGEQIILISDQFTFETGAIASLTSTSITLVGQLRNVWDVETTSVYPVKVVNMSPVGAELWKVNARRWSFEFTVIGNQDLADEDGFATYKGVPIFDQFWGLSGDTYGRSFDIEATRYQSVGDHLDRSSRDFPKVRTTLSVWVDNRSDWWSMKRFLLARRGRQKTMWVRSYRPDFTLESDSGLNNINVDDVYYSDQVFSNPKNIRRDLAFVFRDGTIAYREVVGATRTPGVREVLVLDTDLPQNATAALLEGIQYFYRMRLSSDTLELKHDLIHEGLITVPLVEVVE